MSIYAIEMFFLKEHFVMFRLFHATYEHFSFYIYIYISVLIFVIKNI